MIIDSPILTRRLELRNLTGTDAGTHYLSWLADENISRFLEVRFSPISSLEPLAKFVELCNQSSSDLLLGIFLRDEARHIGNIKLGSICRNHNRADLGFLIGSREEWGKGYAAEAIAAVARFAFTELNLAKLTAGCYASNQGSVRALEKAGFVQEARLRDHWLYDGRREDGFLFAMHADGEHSWT